MRYQMLFDRLLVKPLSAGDRTKSGLFIPNMATDGTPWQRGEVLEVGQGRPMADGSTVPLQVQKGDVVMYFRSQSGGEQLVVPDDDGNDLLCVREMHVLAILKDLDRDSGILTPEGGRFTVAST